MPSLDDVLMFTLGYPFIGLIVMVAGAATYSTWEAPTTGPFHRYGLVFGLGFAATALFRANC